MKGNPQKARHARAVANKGDSKESRGIPTKKYLGGPALEGSRVCNIPVCKISEDDYQLN